MGGNLRSRSRGPRVPTVKSATGPDLAPQDPKPALRRHLTMRFARLAAKAARYTFPPAGLSPAIHVRVSLTFTSGWRTAAPVRARRRHWPPRGGWRRGRARSRQRPCAPGCQAPAEAVVAARVREPEAEMRGGGEGAAESRYPVAELRLQAARARRPAGVVVGGEPGQRLAGEQRVHAARRRVSVTAYMKPFDVRLNGATPCSG